jgi:serine/threonine-protein kinase RsbW
VDLNSLTPPERELVLELPSDLEAIEQAVEFVMRRCANGREEQKRLRLNFRVSLVEALSNAMLYGNGEDPGKRVRIEVVVRYCSVTARVTDEGRGFDPTRIADPTTPANLLKPGGRGLFLMRKLMDHVQYNDEGNSVTMVLRLNDGTSRAQA